MLEEGAEVSEPAELDVEVESGNQQSLGKYIYMTHSIHPLDGYTTLVRPY